MIQEGVEYNDWVSQYLSWSTENKSVTLKVKQYSQETTHKTHPT